jgi:hypothetical protein
MPYVIYQLVESSSLARLEGEEERLMVLRRLNRWGVNEEHSSFEKAFEEIAQHKKELYNMQFVILPTIMVDYEGNIE